MSGWDPDAAGVVTFPDGTRARGRALARPADPADDPPDRALHLLGRPPPPTDRPATWIRWRDFGLPADRDRFLGALRTAHRRAADGERVEVACRGGSGRTGTALACWAILAGVDPADAVRWIRRHYRPGAVETPWQRRFVRTLTVDGPAAQPPGGGSTRRR